MRLRGGADNNQFSFNTFKANAENGVLIGDSQANTFYLNNFLAEKSNFYARGQPINSTKELTYSYSGNVFTGFAGNYYSNYVGSDSDRNGIADTPFSQDKYPLIKAIENYGTVQPTPTLTAYPSTAASTTSTAYENTTAPMVGQRALAAVPGFETATAIFGLLFATVIAVV